MKRSPLKPVGAVRKRWATHQRKCRIVAAARAQGRCEACRLYYGVELQWHHTFGRTGEPWASELTVMLCPWCHQAITDEINPELKRVMRTLALNNLSHRRGVTLDDVDDCPQVHRTALILVLEDHS